MTSRANLLILCPRCGLGNRLRSMVGAIEVAQQFDLQLAHLWHVDSSVGSAFLFANENSGTSKCDFETLFEPIEFFEPFVNEGQRVRLLTEHVNLCRHSGIQIVDEQHYPGNGFQHRRPIGEDDLAGVDAVLLLTSLSMPISDATKIEIYQKYFKPKPVFLDRLEFNGELLKGNWLCVHLRKGVRTAFGLPEWRHDAVVRATSEVLARQAFDRIIVFSDCPDARREFMDNRFDGIPILSVDWGTDDYIEKMFLDFLAMSRASFILGSGLSSFSREAALFGGGVPHHDIFFDKARTSDPPEGAAKKMSVSGDKLRGDSYANSRATAQSPSSNRTAASRLQFSGPPRILFASYHCVADPASGAALCTRDTLELLARRGWQTRVLCGPQMDQEGNSPQQVLADQRLSVQTAHYGEGSTGFSMLNVAHPQVPTTVFVPDAEDDPAKKHLGVFASLYSQMLRDWKPDVLLTYGGPPVGTHLVDQARTQGVRVVFAVHNFSYRASEMLDSVDSILVPSRFCADYYGHEHGLECDALPNPLIWSRVRHPSVHLPRYVTFVNPRPEKGVYVFVRIAAELARLRPDIPILVVESRADVSWLSLCGVDLSDANIQYMNNTSDPRMFYSASRMVVMPSLWNESFGRVAAEAMINGLPLLASDRGAIPEIVGDGGFLFEIPESYTSSTRVAPSADEVQQWVETIIRLWDDEQYYEEASRRAQARAELFSEETTATLYDEYFRRLVQQDSLVGER